MGKGLGLPTTAQGIEGHVHARKLVELGCETGRGYYFGRAMTAGEAGELADLRAPTTPDKPARAIRFAS